jgi:hypothetical protein
MATKTLYQIYYNQYKQTNSYEGPEIILYGVYCML